MHDDHIFSNNHTTSKPTYGHPLTAIILAASHGKRMKSMGAKCLLKYNGYHTILERQINTLQQMCSNVEIIVVTGFEQRKVRHKVMRLYGNRNVRTILNPLHETTGPAYSLMLGYEAATSPSLLIMHGDLVFPPDTIVGMCGGDKSKLLIGKGCEAGEVGVTLENDGVQNIAYGLMPVWKQMAYITGPELHILNKMEDIEQYKYWYTHEMLSHMIGKGANFVSQPTTNQIIDVDIPSQVKTLKHYIYKPKADGEKIQKKGGRS